MKDDANIISLAGARQRRADAEKEQESLSTRLGRLLTFGMIGEVIADFVKSCRVECPCCGEPERLYYQPPLVECICCQAMWHEGLDGVLAQRYRAVSVEDLKAP